MRLGLVLSGIKLQKKIPYRFRGKYRIVKKPSMPDLLMMRRDFEREEQNMLILRHPYLTVEQSHGHTSILYDRTKMFIEEQYEKKRQEYSKQVTFADHLSHLGYGESWD